MNSSGGSPIHPSLKQSRNLYLKAFINTQGNYSGINAASLSLIMGDTAAAHKLARKVISICSESLKQEGNKRDYWIIATLGEAFILLGKQQQALKYYGLARKIAGKNYSSIASTRRQLKLTVLRDVVRSTMEVSSMVFLILIGASLFSLVFRGFGGDELVEELLGQLPGGVFAAVLVVMLVMFLLGFVLDFIEITFVVVPIVGPILLAMGLDPVWLGIMIAINLQTSFLTPPFGFALFYLRGVAPAGVTTRQIYQGVMPFIGLQLLTLIILAVWPQLATWLPDILYGT